MQVFNLLSKDFFFFFKSYSGTPGSACNTFCVCVDMHFFTRARVHKASISKEPETPKAHPYTATGSKLDMQMSANNLIIFSFLNSTK